MVNQVSYPNSEPFNTTKDPARKKRRNKMNRSNQSLFGSRHVLSCFTLFFCLSLVYFIVYISQDGDSFLDRIWLENLELIFDGVNRPPLVSEWNCTDTTIDGLMNLSGNDRVRMCEFRNFCVDRDRGAFLVQNSSKPRPPLVNLVASGKESDRFWTPHIFAQFPSRRYSFIDEKVFVYGLYSPYNFRHWMFNGLLPLWSVMKSYNATPDSWLFRADVWDGEHASSRFDMSYLSSKGRDIVLDPFYKTSAFQILAPGGTVPVCFTRAIVGLGNRCSHKTCDGNIAAEDTLALKEHIFEHYKVDIEILANATALKQKEEEERGGEASTDNVGTIPLQVTIPKDFIIGLVNRKDVQQIVNFDDLHLELKSLGYRLQVISLNSDNDDDLIESAFLFRNISLLIASHGDSLSNALFMPPSSTIISISPHFGNDVQEPWFAGPMLSLGKRFYDWECPDESCIVIDRGLARQCLQQVKLDKLITSEEFEEFVKLERHVADFTRHVKDETKVQALTTAWRCYVRDVPREVDVDLFVSMVERVVQDHINWSPKASPPSTTLVSISSSGAEATTLDDEIATPEARPTDVIPTPIEELEVIDGTGSVEYNKKVESTESIEPTSAAALPTISSPPFPEICRQAKCCGPRCELSMKRNVFGPNNGWKQSVEHGLEVRVRARNWKLAE